MLEPSNEKIQNIQQEFVHLISLYTHNLLERLRKRHYRVVPALIDQVEKTNNLYTGSSKNMDGIWNRYNLKSTGRIYTLGVLKCSEKFKVLDLP